MKEWLLQLAETCGPTGHEDNVREVLRELAAPYADEIRVDVLGNLIATKKGKKGGKRLMLLAHMDEPGLMVNHIEHDGFLRIAPVGVYANLPAGYLISQRVEFPNGTVGVIGSGAVKSPGDVSPLTLFIDIGSASREEAEQKVRIGDFCALKQAAFELGGNKIVGKALDSRASCVVALEVLKRLESPEHDIAVVFSVQQGVSGGRGAKPAAFAVDPDFGLVLDAVQTGDTPGAMRSEIRLGNGPAIKLLDKAVVVQPQIKNFMIQQAQAGQVKHQLEVQPHRTSEAGGIFAHSAGLPVGALSVPIRYSATGSELVDLRDLEAAAELSVRILEQYNLS